MIIFIKILEKAKNVTIDIETFLTQLHFPQLWEKFLYN